MVRMLFIAFTRYRENVNLCGESRRKMWTRILFIMYNGRQAKRRQADCAQLKSDLSCQMKPFDDRYTQEVCVKAGSSMMLINLATQSYITMYFKQFRGGEKQHPSGPNTRLTNAVTPMALYGNCQVR